MEQCPQDGSLMTAEMSPWKSSEDEKDPGGDKPIEKKSPSGGQVVDLLDIALVLRKLKVLLSV